MCERTYVACPHCGEPADGEVRLRELATELIRFHVDADGDVDHDLEPEYGEGHVDSECDGYECNACGWSGSVLDEERAPEECECAECFEPDPEDEGEDPNELVLIVRRIGAMHCEPEADWPIEAKLLYRRREDWCLAAPRWRVAELAGMNAFIYDLLAEFAEEIPPAAIALAPDYDNDERKVLTHE